jgi:multiple sugar transport system ATP-binding protein
MRTEISKLHNRLGTTTIYVTHDQTEAMTMADRIVVLKDGEVQQVASPQEMYERPRNVFVAGFIGSPAMNFINAHIEREDGNGESPSDTSGYAAVFGERARQTRIPLSKEMLSEHPEIGEYVDSGVILGVRPEHMEDESMANSGDSGDTQSILEVEPEVMESMGSEKYVYFSPGKEQVAHSKTLDAMISADADEADGSGGDSENGSSDGLGSFGDMMVARLAAESAAKKGENLRLRIEADKIRLFDPESEEAIS